MKNTIEKALQKQNEAKRRQQAASKVNEPAPDELLQPSGDSPEPNFKEANTSQAVSADVKQPSVTETTNNDDIAPSSPNMERGQTSSLPEFKIDLERLEEKGHISIAGERKQINEEYREIKRKLLANAFGSLAKTLHNPNIIMVSSSRPSEGKTFTAVNLALSIAAEQDKTVLLVDADVLKPNVLNTLGLERRKGLMEYLTGDVEDISDVLYPTNIEKLKIIPKGVVKKVKSKAKINVKRK